MRHRLLWLIAVLSIVASASAQKLTAQEIFKRFSPMVFSIKTDLAQGTAFTVYEDTAFTCYHVLEGGSKASVELSDGRTLPVVSVLAADKARDIALVYVPGLTNPALKHGKDPNAAWAIPMGDYAAVEVGEPVYVIGNPLDLTATLTEGIVSGKRNLPDTDLLQLSAGVSHGSSGSPVFNAKGQVIAMVVGSNEKGQLLNFAVSAKDMKTLPWGLPLSVACPPDKEAPAALPTVSQPAAPTGLLSKWDHTLASVAGLPDDAENLRGLSDFSVYIAKVPTPLSSSIKGTDLTLWVTNQLVANGLKIIPEEQQNSRATKLRNDDLANLHQQDAALRYIEVDVEAQQTKSGMIFYSIDVDVYRGAFIYPGIYVAARVASRGSTGYFGKDFDKVSKIRAAVTREVQAVADLIRAANPPSGGY